MLGRAVERWCLLVLVVAAVVVFGQRFLTRVTAGAAAVSAAFDR